MDEKATWWLLGMANADTTNNNGFQVGWQYHGWDKYIKEYMNGDQSRPIHYSDEITVNRKGVVTITDAIKNASDKLYQVGVIFVLGQWGDPAVCLGGKFEWIGHGEDGGEMHDTNTQSVVRKMEKPVGVTKPQNYWYRNGCKMGPAIVSELLKYKSGHGGVIVACTNGDGTYSHVYKWANIPGESY